MDKDKQTKGDDKAQEELSRIRYSTQQITYQIDIVWKGHQALGRCMQPNIAEDQGNDLQIQRTS